MATLSLGQAAKLANVGKTTIARAIASGRLSAGRKDDGGYEIDPAELARVYDVRPERLEQAARGETVDGDGAEERDETLTEAVERVRHELEMTILREQIAALRMLVEAEKDRRAAVEADRDRWAAQAERIAALLPPPAPPAPANDAPAETRKAGLLDRLFGKRVA